MNFFVPYGECPPNMNYCMEIDCDNCREGAKYEESMSRKTACFGEKMNQFRIFKIQRLTDKLFSNVGNNWDEHGKMWRTLGHVKQHINSNRHKFKNNPSVIVTYTIEEIGREPINVS